MAEFDSIDGWFEKGFRVRRQSAAKQAKGARRDRARSAAGGSPAKRGEVSFSPGAKASNVRAVARKAPEVMVKITGHSKGTKKAGAHLDYISRNGKVELTNEAGEVVTGARQVRAQTEILRAAQIPEEGRQREFLHVVFSMPAGTPERGVREAVAEFCQEEFANRRYFMALHDDKDHCHVHVCVGTRDIDRADEARLSPRKDDLFRWRQGFADKLREQGIDAAASERRHRFQYLKAERSEVRQIRMDNPASPVFDKRRAEAREAARAASAAARPERAFVGPLRPPRTPRVYEGLADELKVALKAGKRPENPALPAQEESRKKAVTAWGDLAAALERQGDKDLAGQVRALIEGGQVVPPSRTQALYDLAQGGRQVAALGTAIPEISRAGNGDGAERDGRPGEEQER